MRNIYQCTRCICGTSNQQQQQSGGINSNPSQQTTVISQQSPPATSTGASTSGITASNQPVTINFGTSAVAPNVNRPLPPAPSASSR